MEVADQGQASLCNGTGAALLQFIIASNVWRYDWVGSKCRGMALDVM